MPILDIQKRAATIGRIRIGQLIPGGTNEDGTTKYRPAKLGTFRLTTSSEHAARAVAELLGGAVEPWPEAKTAGQLQVITEQSVLPITIPPGPPDTVVSQWYELWTAAGCARRCDGVTETLSGEKCLCPADQLLRAEQAKRGRACRMTTRVNVLIPDLPGLGTWMCTTHGYYSASELGGTAEVLAQAAARGLLMPANLRIDQREVRKPGEKPKQFPVIALEVLSTLRQITHAVEAGSSMAAALPPAPTPVAAIESGQPAPALPAGAPHGQAAPAAASRGPNRQRAATQAAGQASSPRSAQDLANAALAASSTKELERLWDDARATELLDEFVDDGTDTDTLDQLGAVMRRRWQQIAGGDQ